MSANKLKIVHIINSMEHGGAETMLCNIILRTNRERFEPTVLSLIDNLSAAAPLMEVGVPMATMGMRPGVPDPRGFVRLYKTLKRLDPDVIQTWMDHSNLIGGLTSAMSTRAAVVWGIHHSHHVRGLAKRTTLWTVATCARLSRRLPAKVVCCSEKSREFYLREGFSPDTMTVIPNGFDTDRFRPDPSARLALRRELGLEPDAPLIGLVARYDVLKDHATFVKAAAILAGADPAYRFVLCGREVNAKNTALVNLIASLGLTERFHLLGHRADVPRIQAALDVATSSSISEAFPLAVGEAMACAVPCVVTDVGDSALMVGNEGRVVPPSNPEALARGCLELLRMPADDRIRLGQAARRRVTERFDLGVVTRSYEALYERHRPVRRTESIVATPTVAEPVPD